MYLPCSYPFPGKIKPDLALSFMSGLLGYLFHLCSLLLFKNKQIDKQANRQTSKQNAHGYKGIFLFSHFSNHSPCVLPKSCILHIKYPALWCVLDNMDTVCQLSVSCDLKSMQVSFPLLESVLYIPCTSVCCGHSWCLNAPVINFCNVTTQRQCFLSVPLKKF